MTPAAINSAVQPAARPGSESRPLAPWQSASRHDRHRITTHVQGLLVERLTQKMKSRVQGAALALATGFALGTSAAAAGGTLIVGMTAGDLPITTGNPDQGFEGYRFVGYNLYDSLILWDLSKADKASELKAGLATDWAIDPANTKRWILKLRPGVKWHDGCPFTAEDVVWNMERSTNDKSPQFEPNQFAQARAYLNNFASVEKIDDLTVAFNTKVPDSLFQYNISYLMMVSPCRAKELNYEWGKYMERPSGTGPYRFARVVPHQRMEMTPNADYWDKNRVPRHDRLVLIPMPEASTRTAALLSGQVNFIEAPSPDSIARLKSSGMTIVTNPYPHNWTYQLNFANGPFADRRVRQAANYAINREDMKELLNGLMLEGYATVPPSTAYYGKPIQYKRDVEKAKALLKEAGCLPCKVTFAISTSGSGQMQPLPMNELVKSNMEEAGFQVTLQTMDWNALLDLTRAGVDKFREVNAINVSRQTQDPFNGLVRHVWTTAWSPRGANWGHYSNPDMDNLIGQIMAEFDPAKRNALLTKMHEFVSTEAALIFVAHDVNPRALSPKVKGFVQAQSWFQDLTPITVAP